MWNTKTPPWSGSTHYGSLLMQLNDMWSGVTHSVLSNISFHISFIFRGCRLLLWWTDAPNCCEDTLDWWERAETEQTQIAAEPVKAQTQTRIETCQLYCCVVFGDGPKGIELKLKVKKQFQSSLFCSLWRHLWRCTTFTGVILNFVAVSLLTQLQQWCHNLLFHGDFKEVILYCRIT